MIQTVTKNKYSVTNKREPLLHNTYLQHKNMLPLVHVIYIEQVFDDYHKRVHVSCLFQASRRTALIWAAWYGHLEITRVLLDRGCKKEAKDVCYITSYI